MSKENLSFACNCHVGKAVGNIWLYLERRPVCAMSFIVSPYIFGHSLDLIDQNSVLLGLNLLFKLCHLSI